MATTSVRPPSAEVVGRQFVRDPDSGLLYVAAAVAILSAVQIFVYPFGRTLSEYAIGGRELLLGGAPGKTFWSLRAPGIAILHACIQRCISGTPIAARAVEVLCLSGLVYLSIRLCKRFVGLERAGLLGGAIALYLHSQLEYEHTGQPELFATLFVGIATVIAVRDRSRRGRYGEFLAIGANISVAILFVPLFALTVVPLLIWIWREEREQRLGSWAPWLASLTVIASMGIGPGLFGAWLYWRGALGLFVADWLGPQLLLWSAWSPDGFLEWLYFTTDRLVLRQSALVPAGLLLAYTMPRLHHEERRGLRLLLGLALCELLAFVLSYESNPGRLSGALPILSIMAGIGLYKVFRRLLGQGPSAVVAFGSGLVLLAMLCTAVNVAPGTYFYRSWVRLRYIAGLMPYRAPELLENDLYCNAEINLPASRRVAASLVRMRPRDREVLVQGDEPQVLWLAKLRPATRLSRPIPADIADIDPDLDARFTDEIERSLPRVIVQSPADSEANQPSAARRLGFSQDTQQERYDLAAERDGWSLRVLKP